MVQNWRTLSFVVAVGSLIAAVAFLIIVVTSAVSQAAQSSSSAFTSQTGSGSKTQPTSISSVRSTSPATPTATQVQIDRTPPRITYFVAPDADQSVKDALSDGFVTFEEYTQAVNNTMACLDKKGVVHTTPVYNEDRGQYVYGATDSTGPGGVSDLDECWMRYERDVQGAWVKASPPLDVVPINETGALECATEQGLNAHTFADLQALKRANPTDPVIQHCYVIGTNGFDPSGPRSGNP